MLAIVANIAITISQTPRTAHSLQHGYSLNCDALWAEATEAIQKYGAMVKSRTAPYVSITNRQAEIMMRIASEFGFTPASRSRIATRPDSQPNLFDPIESAPEGPKYE